MCEWKCSLNSFFFFEDWDFFSELGKKYLDSIENEAGFRLLRTQKIPGHAWIQNVLSEGSTFDKVFI